MSELNLYHIPNTSDDNSQEIQDIVDTLGSSKSTNTGQIITQTNGMTEQQVRDIVNQHLSTGVTEDRVRALIESTSRFKTGMNILMDGYLKSQNFYTGVSGWQIDADGNVEFGSGYFRGDITGASGTFSGTLTATAGVIGGFTINSTSLSTGAFDTLNTMYFGTSGLSLSNTFKVNSAGALTATGATISGAITATSGSFTGSITATSGTIGGFTLSSTALYAGTGATRIGLDTSSGIYLGATTFGASPFSVSLAGALIATNATITGAITATSGSFTGAITSTSGTIGGFTLAGTNLSAGTGVTRIDLDTGAGISLGDSTFATAPFSVTLAGVLKAQSGTIGGTTITDTTLYGGIIQTSATVGEGSNGVILDSDGLRGYNGPPDNLGLVFNLPTDGSPPTFASGTINETTFNITNAAVIQTSTTVGDGSTSSAGILINNAGIFACEASQLLADANVKILIDGSAVIKMNVKGGQTDYNTGTGYFLGSSGGDYKLSIGSPAGNYLTWDGAFLKLKGSLDVGVDGLINNSVYTNATLPSPAVVVGFNVPSAYE